MAGVEAVIAVLLAVALGYTLHRIVVRAGAWSGPVSGTVLWGIVGTGGWLSLLSLTGIDWRAWLVPLPLLFVAPIVLLRPHGPHPRPFLDRWLVIAVAAVLPRMVAVAMTPAYGWDFRYLWGLKANVFAAAHGIDTFWLAWQPLADLHPSYPPLWPELLATGQLLGSPVASTAAAWGAVLVVGLAAAGWDAARGLGRPVQAVAAAALAWAPVLFRPERSGYAEPLAAFLLAVSLTALDAASRDRRGALMTLAAAAPALALVKNEGAVLAVACVVAALVTSGRRALPAAILTFSTTTLWRLVVVVNDLPRPGAVRDPSIIAERSLALPATVAAALTTTLGWMAIAWLLLTPVLLTRRLRAPATVLLVWVGAATTAYLTTPWGVAWHMAWSLDRVVAVALPAALAVAIPAAFRAAAAPPGPDTVPAG